MILVILAIHLLCFYTPLHEGFGLCLNYALKFFFFQETGGALSAPLWRRPLWGIVPWSQPRPAPAPPRGAGSGRAEAAAGKGEKGEQADAQSSLQWQQHGATIPRLDISATHYSRALPLLL